MKTNNLHLRHQAPPCTHSTNFHHITRVAAWCLKSSKRTAICCSWTQNQLTTSLGIEPCRIGTGELKAPANQNSFQHDSSGNLFYQGFVSVEQKLLRNSTLTSNQICRLRNWQTGIISYHLYVYTCIYMYESIQAFMKGLQHKVNP